MARNIKSRALKPAIAIIVDGEDEMWYVSKAKEYYPNDELKRTRIKPEIFQHKKCEDLFLYAKQKIEEGYTSVILILDLDTIRNCPEELESFKVLYSKFKAAKNSNSPNRSIKWMKDLTVLVNNPCLEFWYLLHFKRTTRYYDCYSSLRSDLRRIKVFADYDKGEKYYLNSPDIFQRLGGLTGLSIARSNSDKPGFVLEECECRGISEMAQLFDFFDGLV